MVEHVLAPVVLSSSPAPLSPCRNRHTGVRVYIPELLLLGMLQAKDPCRPLIPLTYAGALEHALARGMAAPELMPIGQDAAALRLGPAERVAIANEVTRLGLLAERVVHAAVPAPATRPRDAQVWGCEVWTVLATMWCTRSASTKGQSTGK